MTQNKPFQIFLALMLIVAGVLALIGMSVAWPLFIIVPGVIILSTAFLGERATAPMAIPGMLVTGTGLLLFLQNLTGYWESWSYVWTLYGVFLGAGFIIMGRLMGDESTQALGRIFMKIGLMAFIGFAFLMELVIGVGGSAVVMPVVLIALGLFLVAQTLADRGLIPALPCTNPAKRKRKAKRDDHLFTGPIVYGTRGDGQRIGSRLRVPTPDDDERAGNGL